MLTKATASAHPVLTAVGSILGALLVLCLFLLMRGIYPFGGHGLEYMDNGQMVYPALKYYASALMSGVGDGAFFYDIHSGAGIRVSPSFPHQLLVPSTWVAVFMGDSFLLKDMVWVMMVDVACACLTAAWFLRKVFPSLSLSWTVLLTVGYAVGGFFQTKYGFMQFLDHAAMFPLFALGLYRLVNGGRGWLYAVGLFLLATSMYSAFMAVVIGWLFAWAYTLPLKGSEERRIYLSRVFWYTAAVVLGTCYYWLPMMEMSHGSMRSLFVTAPTLLELLWPFDPPRLLERLYACMPGMALTALMTAYLVQLRKSGQVPAHAVRLFLLLLGASVLPVLLEPVHRAAHLWSYVDFSVRFGFIPSLIAVSFCAWILTRERWPLAGKGSGLLWWLSGLVATFVLSLLLLELTQHDLLLRLLPLLFFCLAWLAWRRFEGGRLIGCIAAVMLAGLSVSAAVFWKQGYDEKAAVRCEHAESLAEGMRGYDGLLRIKDTDRLLMENSACLGHLPTVSNFRHTTSITHFRFLKNLGYRDEFTRTYGQGGTRFSDALLGHGFELVSHRKKGEEPMLVRDGMFLYRLPCSSWSRVVREDILGLEFDERLSPFQNINVLYRALDPSVSGPLYVPAASVVECSGPAFRMKVSRKEGAMYGFPLTDIDQLQVNGQAVVVMADAQQSPAGGGFTYNGILSLRGMDDAGDVLITGVMRRHVDVPLLVYAACQPEYRDTGISDMRENIREEGRGGHVKVSMNAGEGEALMIPVVYDRGWKASRNGSPVAIEQVGELMAVRLLPGANEVVFDYFPPVLKQSLVFSLAAVVVFLLYGWWAGRHLSSAGRKFVLKTGYWLFQGSACMVWFAVYAGSVILFIALALW